MRNDFARVLQQGRRHGGRWKDSPKYGGRVRVIHDPDHLYEDEAGGIHPSDHYGHHSEYSNPLRRALRRSCGRPWDDVYSELCATFRSPHDRWRVSKTIRWMVDRKGLWQGSSGTVYDKDDMIVDGLYVHPVTGILCYSPRKPYWHRSNQQPPQQPIEQIDLTTEQVPVSVFSPWWQIRRSKIAKEAFRLEECGRGKRRFKTWFHYRRDFTVKASWVLISRPRIAKNDHFTGKELPYVDAAQEFIYRQQPDKYRKREDGFWYVKHEQEEYKETKRSCNREQMAWIREYLAEQARKS